MSTKYDVAVLGGGPGGYPAAIRASQLGFKTVVVEKDNLGGVCLNWGCIPTKSLLKNAELYEMMNNHADDFGLKVSGLEFDFSKIIERSRGVAAKMSKGVDFLMKKNKIDVVKGFGKITSKGTITVYDDNEKETDKVKADHIIISTGARPKRIPPIPVDGEKIITSKEAMVLNKVPKELVVIGAGAIGVEFAYFYHALGSKVTIVEMMDRILPVEDEEVSKTLERSFKKRKMKIYTSTKVENAEVKKDKVVVKIEKKNGEKEELNADIVLNAIGVSGNVEAIGLEELGVELEKGYIKVDKKTYKTNVDGIYAIGDVIGPPWLAHVATKEAEHCVEMIKGMENPPIDYDTIPGCTYCIPQVASIGLTEAQAKEQGLDIKVGKFPFSASGKASAIGDNEGFVKLIFGEKYGELLGAHIIGAEATEIIAELGVAMTLEADFQSLIKTVHAHPTLSEAVMEAAAQAYGHAIHI